MSTSPKIESEAEKVDTKTGEKNERVQTAKVMFEARSLACCELSLTVSAIEYSHEFEVRFHSVPKHQIEPLFLCGSLNLLGLVRMR